MDKAVATVQKYPHLFSPIKIGALTAKNRIEATPVGLSDLTKEGHLTRENAYAYEAKARGGAAIITIGESNVYRRLGGTAHGRMVPLDDEEVLPGLINTTDAIHRHGALASIELLHPGRRANPHYFSGITIGPSGCESGVYGVPVVEMTEEMIAEVVEAFGDAAEMAKLGGCDMVMVHGGHGWLIHQFISFLNNKRTDRFGGSLENRARFALMVIENIRRKCGPDFPIEFRMSGSELTEGGLTLADQTEFAKLLDGRVDLIHVSDGTFDQPNTNVVMFPSMFLERGCNVYLAEEIRRHVKTPVAAVGAIGTPEQMEEIIATGRADIIGVARALIADPDLPNKALYGRADDITPCQRCMLCNSGNFVPYIKYPTRVGRCTVNPQIGKEFELFTTVPTGGRKRVLIVGGGPGGMQAAVTAAQRGHEVVLCEKTDSLGGQLKYAKHVSFKQDMDRYLNVMIRRVGRLPIEVRLNTEVTPEYVKAFSPDALLVAIGAEPMLPDIHGIDGKNVIQGVNAHDENAQVGKRVVIVGGGTVGCETAMEYKRSGREVTVLERREAVAIDCPYLHREALLIELEKTDARLLVNQTVREITEQGVLAAGKDGKEVLYPADTVVVATGMKPRRDEADRFRGLAKDVQAIGDCHLPRRIREAVRAGYDFGMHL